MDSLLHHPQKLKTLKFSKTQIDELQTEPLSHLPGHDQLFPEEVDTQDHFGSQYVLKEKSPWRLIWSAVLCTLLIYTTSVFLFRFTFYDFHIGPDGHEAIKTGEKGWHITDWIVDILFWIDLIVIFFFSFSDEKGREVDSLKLIAINYLSFYFWVNLLACIPPSFMQWLLKAITSGESDHDDEEYNPNPPAPPDDNDGLNSNVLRVYRLQQISRMTRLARVARLVRIVRLVKFVSIFRSSTFWKHVHSFRGLRILNFLCGLIWVVHVLACGWYLCAAVHDDVDNTWVAKRAVNSDGKSLLAASPYEQWLASMYFVLTVFTTVGFGDISATTEGEIYYVGFTMLVGAVVQSIIISEVIGIVTSQDEVQKLVHKQAVLIENYSKHTQLAPEITKELKNEVSWKSRHWASSYGFDKCEMKSLLTGQHVPRWLMAKMPKSLWNGALARNDILQIGATVPSRLPCLLAMHLVMCEFSVGETIYQMGDFPFTLFLVVSGTFAHVGLPQPSGGADAILLDDEDSADRLSQSGYPSTGTPPKGPTSALASNVGLVDKNAVSSNKPDALFPYRLFSYNSYFGDTELIWGKPRFATTRCERDGVALTLHKADFLEVQEMFPQFKAAWALSARRRERFRAQCLGKLKHGNNYKRLAALKIMQFLKKNKVVTRQARYEIGEITSSTGSLYITGLQPPLSEIRQTQAAMEKLNVKMDNLQKIVLEALGRGGGRKGTQSMVPEPSGVVI